MHTYNNRNTFRISIHHGNISLDYNGTRYRRNIFVFAVRSFGFRSRLPSILTVCLSLLIFSGRARLHGKSLRRLAPSFPPGKGILDPYLFLGLHVAINGFILSLASRDIKISFPPSRMKRSTDREKEREERAKRNWSNGVRR